MFRFFGAVFFAGILGLSLSGCFRAEKYDSRENDNTKYEDIERLDTLLTQIVDLWSDRLKSAENRRRHFADSPEVYEALEMEFLKAQLAQVRNRQRRVENAETAADLRGREQEILTKIRTRYAERITLKERQAQVFSKFTDDLRMLKIESLTFELDEARRVNAQ